MRVSYVKPGQTNPLELFVRGRRAAEESDFGIYINTAAGYERNIWLIVSAAESLELSEYFR